MNTAGQYDIFADQGSTFSRTVTLEDSAGDPVSLVGATVSGKVRVAPESTAVIATMTGTVTDGPNGEFTIVLSAAVTAAIACDASGAGNRVLTTFVYDCEVTYSDLTVQRVLEGNFYLSPEVNR